MLNLTFSTIPAPRRLLPAVFSGVDVLDLGCGFRVSPRQKGARPLRGMDISQRMLNLSFPTILGISER